MTDEEASIRGLSMQLCVFTSTPDMEGLDFVVKVLTGSPEELAQRAVAWGYDGIEFMPNPEDPPEPERMERALREAGALLPVVNTGRMFTQGSPRSRRRSPTKVARGLQKDVGVRRLL